MYTFARFVSWVEEVHGKESGYYITYGDSYRDPRAHGQLGVKKAYGSANSVHKLRLAVDVNCIKDGQLVADFYPDMHDQWESMGGAKRIPKDLNHFSFEHNGKR